MPCLAMAIPATVKIVDATSIMPNNHSAIHNLRTPTLVCRVVKESTTYSNAFEVWEDEKTLCTPIVNGKDVIGMYKVQLPEHILNNHTKAIDEGTLRVTIPRAQLTKDSVIGYDIDSVSVQTTRDHSGTRSGGVPVATIGTRTVLVLRVSVQDAEPSFSAQEFQDRIFGDDDITVQSQYKACSSGKLNMEPSSYGVGGVLDVRLGNSAIADFESNTALSNAAQDAAADFLQLNGGQVSDLADHIMICLPPGTGNWVASAAINHWRSVYNNEFCGILSASMHELG
jgi:hypothetical protein